jgi:hypothetical protein
MQIKVNVNSKFHDPGTYDATFIRVICDPGGFWRGGLVAYHESEPDES